MSKVTVLHQQSLQLEVVARGHSLVADEPREAGGDDAGMNPYELLLAALGSCTAMTLLLYARRKGWDLRDVQVELEHERVHAEDCEGCEGEGGRIDRIRRAITLKGDLGPEQVARLGEIAARCPVHKTLTGEIRIEDQVRRGM
jgi:putative redox protein